MTVEGRRCAVVVHDEAKPLATRRLEQRTQPYPWRIGPDRVTTLMTDEAERPRSAPKRFVAIWNSCTASMGRFSSGPPTTSSLLAWPSIVMLPPRPNWPADDTSTLLVLVGSNVGCGVVAWHEHGQLEEVPAVERQGLDGLGPEHAVDGRRHGARGFGDRNRHLHRTNGEPYVELVILADLQGDTVRPPRRKAGQLHVHAVGPWWQERNREVAIGAARGGPCHARGEVAHRHGCARCGSILGVGYTSRECGHRSLRSRSGGEEQDDRARQGSEAQVSTVTHGLISLRRMLTSRCPASQPRSPLRQRCRVSVLRGEPRALAIRLRVGRRPRAEPVDVSVEEAEQRCDEDGVVDLEI